MAAVSAIAARTPVSGASGTPGRRAGEWRAVVASLPFAGGPQGVASPSTGGPQGVASPFAGGPQAVAISSTGGPQGVPALGADRLSLTSQAYRAQAPAPVRTQGLIPAWISVLGFLGVWGIWGFPAALLGAVGVWAVNKVASSV